jgi:pimeloyl-ACP methyl ester carboxylesterase
MDYGLPIGYRLAVKYPERVEALIVMAINPFRIGTDVQSGRSNLYVIDISLQ